MSLLPYPRVTPWVGRLIAANAVVLLLMQTLFTSPELAAALAFDPAAIASRPWAFITYFFVHGGLLHLLRRHSPKKITRRAGSAVATHLTKYY